MVKELIDGAQQFKHYQYEHDNDLMAGLVENGQSPDYFIVSCIDSRTNPATLFRAKPGAFFAHKAMGAIVRPYKQGTALAAALQFALKYNKVKTLIVLGHTQCGAVRALAENIDDEEISSFVSVAKNALHRAQQCCSNHDDILNKTEQETVLESVENLKNYPSVKLALNENRLTIKPWIFDMRSGDLLEYNYDKSEFIPLTTTITPPKEKRKNA